MQGELGLNQNIQSSLVILTIVLPSPDASKITVNRFWSRCILGIPRGASISCNSVWRKVCYIFLKFKPLPSNNFIPILLYTLWSVYLESSKYLCKLYGSYKTVIVHNLTVRIRMFYMPADINRDKCCCITEIRQCTLPCNKIVPPTYFNISETMFQALCGDTVLPFSEELWSKW